MATLKYNGSLPKVEVMGYGHFEPGEEKTVDETTAVQFDCEPCAREGWIVEFDGKKRTSKSGDDAPEKISDLSPRGPRNAPDTP